MSDNHCDNIRSDMPACLRNGHQRIAPGVYNCSENHCHINGPELCIANGYPATPENIEMLVKVALEMSSEETQVEIIP